MSEAKEVIGRLKCFDEDLSHEKYYRKLEASELIRDTIALVESLTKGATPGPASQDALAEVARAVLVKLAAGWPHGVDGMVIRLAKEQGVALLAELGLQPFSLADSAKAPLAARSRPMTLHEAAVIIKELGHDVGDRRFTAFELIAIAEKLERERGGRRGTGG